MSKEKFLAQFKDQTEQFKDHDFLVQTIYTEIRKLQNDLPYDQVAVQTEFTENLFCKCLDDV